MAGAWVHVEHAVHAAPHARRRPHGNAEILDLMIHDGLWCAFEHWHMGNSGEVVASEYHVSRGSDRYAAESHHRRVPPPPAGSATKSCPSRSAKKGDPIRIDSDEPIRADATVEALAKLKPAFKKDGTVTAGNAPGVNDGAAALVISSEEWAAAHGKRPLARIVAQAVSGLAPKLVLMTPVEAVRRVAEKAGWKLQDVDLFELN